jgi:hypothetical protein
VTEKKMDNMHLLNNCQLGLNVAEKLAEKGEKGEKSDGKKDIQYAFIRSMGGYIKIRRKWAEKGREGEESDGKKDGQYAFIKNNGQLGLNVT